MKYLKELVVKHRAVLDSAEYSDIKRMAWIGDSILSYAVRTAATKMDMFTAPAHDFHSVWTCNEFLSKCVSIPQRFPVSSVWQKATFVECAIYLESELVGVQAVSREIEIALIGRS